MRFAIASWLIGFSALVYTVLRYCPCILSGGC